MKIAILSDTHDNLANLKKCLDFLKKEEIKIILHCGDVCGVETMKEIKKKFKGKIYLTFGNADFQELKEKIKKGWFKSIEFSENFKEIVIDDLKIGLCHSLELGEKLCQSKRYDFFFFGNTHKPSLKKIGGCYLANPGNLANLYFQPTFAILDTKSKKLNLVLINKLAVNQKGN